MSCHLQVVLSNLYLDLNLTFEINLIISFTHLVVLKMCIYAWLFNFQIQRLLIIFLNQKTTSYSQRHCYMGYPKCPESTLSLSYLYSVWCDTWHLLKRPGKASTPGLLLWIPTILTHLDIDKMDQIQCRRHFEINVPAFFHCNYC